jgi:DNA modification methylase
MIFTDPPYNVAFNGRSGKFDVIMNDDLSEGGEHQGNQRLH